MDQKRDNQPKLDYIEIIEMKIFHWSKFKKKNQTKNHKINTENGGFLSKCRSRNLWVKKWIFLKIVPCSIMHLEHESLNFE